MKTFLIATGNLHKVEEIQAILGEGFRYETLRDYPDAPAAIEDADTFAGNAEIKARSLRDWLLGQGKSGADVWVLADDSGLEVDALEGAPGVYSARYASEEGEGNADDSANNAKLLRNLTDVPPAKRTARFRCVIAVVSGEPGSETQFFDGKCEGAIALEKSGNAGFGYDPLFIPEGYSQTFADLAEEVKNRMSHRASALAEMKKWLAEG